MDEEIETLIVSVRADTRAFAHDVEELRGTIEEPLGKAADKAGRAIENALLKAIRTGKIGFEDLLRVATSILAQIVEAALAGTPRFDTAGPGGTMSGALLGLLAGAPGRATGGPVSPGRPYWVGERGPELFVPASAGSVAAPAAGGVREVRVSITVNAAGGDAPEALARSSRQVARAVKAALAGVE